MNLQVKCTQILYPVYLRYRTNIVLDTARQLLKKQHIPKNTMLHTLQSTVKQFMTSTASYLYITRQLEHLYKVFSNEDRKCTLSKLA